MSSSLPAQFAIPDLSGLDRSLVPNLLLSMVLRGGFPPGDTQHLVTAFTRTTESALRRYEAARVELDASAREPAWPDYLRGVDEMELTFIALNRCMRLAAALRRSAKTTLGRTHLPSQSDQDLLRHMRDPIEHREGPILNGLAGLGRTFALSVRTRDSIIEDATTTYTAAHLKLASWVRTLHELAVRLADDPGAMTRPSV